MRVHFTFRPIWGVAYAPAEGADRAMIFVAPIPFFVFVIEFGGLKDDHDSYGV